MKILSFVMVDFMNLVYDHQFSKYTKNIDLNIFWAIGQVYCLSAGLLSSNFYVVLISSMECTNYFLL